MKLYTFNFNARRVNSQGVWRTYTRSRTGDTYESAMNKLYDEFEHISVNWWSNRDVEVPPN